MTVKRNLEALFLGLTIWVFLAGVYLTAERSACTGLAQDTRTPTRWTLTQACMVYRNGLWVSLPQ